MRVAEIGGNVHCDHEGTAEPGTGFGCQNLNAIRIDGSTFVPSEEVR